MERSFLFLGSGGSMGVPAIACTCAVCQSHSPYNQRMRPSGLLTVGNKRFLIDAGPDFRAQAMRFGITHLDGVLITHTHFDHIAGFDDLRVFYFLHKQSTHCLLSQDSFDEIKIRFHYLFDHSKCRWANFKILEDNFGTITFEGVSFAFVSYFQANMKVTGYRVGPLAYISDIRHYDDAVIAALQGTEILIVSALRLVPTEVHFSLDEAIAFARKVGAKQTFFTHIAHELEHEETNRRLPDDIRLSYDGLEIKF